MGEKGNTAWKVAALVCAALLLGAAIAIVVLALDRGDEGEKKAREDQVQVLEEQVDKLEKEVNRLEKELAEAGEKAEEEEEEEEPEEYSGRSEPGDREQLEALGEAYTDGNYHVGGIVIDGDWARVSIVPNDPTRYQGDCVYFHKVGGEWLYVDMGTGLEYGDIPGAPESIFP